MAEPRLLYLASFLFVSVLVTPVQVLSAPDSSISPAIPLAVHMSHSFDAKASAKRIEAEQEIVQTRLEELERSMIDGPSSDELINAIRLIQQTLTILENQRLTLERFQENSEITVRRVYGHDAGAPVYSFFDYEADLGDLISLNALQATLSQNLEQALDKLEALKKAFESKEKSRRSAHEGQIGRESHDSLILLQAESMHLKAAFDLQEIQYRTLRKDIENNRAAIQQRRHDLNRAGAEVRIPDDYVEQTVRALENYRGELEKNLAELQRKRAQLTVSTARRFMLQEIQLLSQRINRVPDVIEIWYRRRAVLNRNTSRETLRDWLEQAQAAQRSFEKAAQQIGSESAAARSILIAIEGGESAAGPEARSDSSGLEALLKGYDDESLALNAAHVLNARLMHELEQKVGPSRLADALHDLRQVLHGFWTHEVFATADDRPITVRKIALGIMLILIGIVLSRRVSRLLGLGLLPRLGVKHGASAAFESLLFYVLIVTCSITALRLVNVPLTVFTVLGGALAIGVGFGSQTLMNNFISGLILLIEQPMRPGDLVEAGGHKGRVMRIGTRGTTILTKTNIEVVVPNSEILQKSMVNWTLAEKMVKVPLRVSVAYASDTEVVERCLLEAAAEVHVIRSNPSPTVILHNFGDSALEYELHIWVDLSSFADLDHTLSDVRRAIVTSFRARGIQIPYPQRDLHIYPTATASLPPFSKSNSSNVMASTSKAANA